MLALITVGDEESLGCTVVLKQLFIILKKDPSLANQFLNGVHISHQSDADFVEKNFQSASRSWRIKIR
jgi:hypothetical protein